MRLAPVLAATHGGALGPAAGREDDHPLDRAHLDHGDNSLSTDRPRPPLVCRRLVVHSSPLPSAQACRGRKRGTRVQTVVICHVHAQPVHVTVPPISTAGVASALEQVAISLSHHICQHRRLVGWPSGLERSEPDGPKTTVARPSRSDWSACMGVAGLAGWRLDDNGKSRDRTMGSEVEQKQEQERFVP